ncbi:MAG: SUMF1/EgtB/PvdO family nonheme iron enzyme [Deltaproteobacteria bacterium]|nr:SUMF1/EgtB/PvdO family nonheme iron enzyme [Deltaproteobacteria bacterium]MBK8719929.1 SUMF1/EgtB/PvdO family nonheme iron enzyme [Deltaproteobacteria bacterium]MBP7291406.1 SUMF1/EgtB/PvdO family nonheme iron enzyme [Nannocystaceae bacterium]
MGPSRGDTICGNVVIEALAPMHFGAMALGPVHVARSPTEPRLWLVTVERTLLPRSVDVSRFMAGVGELATASIRGAVPLVLVDREADFCVVGYRAPASSHTLAQRAEAGPDLDEARDLARSLALTLADLHHRGFVHGLVTPTTVVMIDDTWQTWEYGIAGLFADARLAPRVRPLGGDALAPEVRVEGVVSAASDVYGWAAAVACLWTGEIGAEAVAAVQDGDDDDPLANLLRACLESIPELRPRDGLELCERLRGLGLLDDRAPSPAGASRSGRFGLPGERVQPSAEPDEFSFADLNEPDVAPAVPSQAAPPEAVIEMLVLGPDEDLGDDEPTTTAAPEVWRELAEQYLAGGAEAAARATEEPGAIAATPTVDPATLTVVPTLRRPAEIARVALVRTRVRTGPQTRLPRDEFAAAGSFEIPDEPLAEPTVPPRAASDARDLPLGGGEEDDWHDDAPVFDLDAEGGPRQVSRTDLPSESDPIALEPLEGDVSWPPRARTEAAPDPAWGEPTPIDGLGSARLRAAPPPSEWGEPTPTVGLGSRDDDDDDDDELFAARSGSSSLDAAAARAGTPEPVRTADSGRLRGPERGTPEPERAGDSGARARGPERVAAADSGKLALDRDVDPRRRTPDPEADRASDSGRRRAGERPQAPTPSGLELDRPRAAGGSAEPSRRSSDEVAAPAGERAGRPAAKATIDRPPSRSHPAISASALALPARPRSGTTVAWTICAAALVLALGTTLSLARHRGGLSQLLTGDDAPIGETAASAVVEPTRRAPSEPVAAPPRTCPEEMRAIEADAKPGVCMDQGEFPGLRQIPRTQINLAEARAACRDRGARLCTMEEWRTACRGPHNWRHPYGQRGELDRCNGASSSGAVQDLSRSGARDRCVTPGEHYDLEGNVAEWVEDGLALGGDSATRSPSCDARLRPSADTRAPTVGLRCCLDLAP